jgi:hypothetical protein
MVFVFLSTWTKTAKAAAALFTPTPMVAASATTIPDVKKDAPAAAQQPAVNSSKTAAPDTAAAPKAAVDAKTAPAAVTKATLKTQFPAASSPVAAAPGKTGTSDDLINGSIKPSQVTVVFTPGIVNKRLYEYDHYLVETIGNGDDPNEKITVKYRPSPSTTPIAEGESTGWVFFTLPVKSTMTNHFYGLSDHWVFVKQGKDSNPGNLIIYDLDTKLKSIAFPYSEPIFDYQSQLIYWQQVTDPVTNENCPEADVRAKAGGKPMMEELILLDLKAQKTIHTHVMRCAARSK